MEIAKQEDLINKITAHYRPYIEALRTPDLKSVGRHENIKAITYSVVKATSLKGQINADSNADVYIAENFYEQIIVKYPFARHGEISLSFQKGALGEYGEYFGINVSTCWKWWKSYIESKELIAAKREWVNLIELPKNDVKPLMLKESMIEPIKNAFKQFKQDGSLPYTSSSFYSIICQLKGVKTLISDKEIRQKIRTEAFNNYRSKLVEKGTNRKDPKTFEEMLELCTKGMNPSYDSESRKLALREYFKECITKNQEPI